MTVGAPSGKLVAVVAAALAAITVVAFIASLEHTLERSYVTRTVTILENATVTVTPKELIDLVEKLSQEREKLQGKLNEYKRLIEELKTRIERLESVLDEASSEKQNLLQQLAWLSTRLQTLNESYRELYERYVNLQEEYRRVLEELRAREEYITSLEKELDQAETELEELRVKLNTLSETLANISVSLKELRYRLNLYSLAELVELRDKFSWLTLQLLDENPELEWVLQQQNLRTMLDRLLTWIALNYQVVGEGYAAYPTLDDDKLALNTFINASLGDGEATCNSLSLLVYTLLGHKLGFDSLKLIAVEGQGRVRLAVLTPLPDEGIALVDPCSQLEAWVRGVHVNPLQLPPGFKQELAERGLLELETSIKVFDPTTEAVSKTLKSWLDVIGLNEPETTVILDPRGLRTIEGLDEAAEIIAGELSPIVYRGLFLTVKGYVDTIAFYQLGNSSPSLLVYTFPAPVETVMPSVRAERVTVSLTGMEIYIPLHRLKLAPGIYTVIGWLGGHKVFEAYVSVNASSIEISGLTLFETSSGCGGLAESEALSIYYALLCWVNVSSINTVASTIYGLAPPSDLASAVWRLLEFLEQRIMYDHARALNPVPPIQDPITTLRRGRGICIDYAVLAVTALQAAGVRTGIAVLSWPGGFSSHAVALADIGGSLFIIDQRLPPIEWQDYLEYVAGPVESIDVLWLEETSGSHVVKAYLDANISVPDTYPADMLEPGLADYIAATAVAMAGLTPAKQLETVMALVYSGILLRLPALEEVPFRTVYPLDVAYSPIFRMQWANWLAEIASELLKQGFPEAISAGGSGWVRIVREGDGLAIYVVAVEGPVPRVEAHATDWTLTLSISLTNIPYVNVYRDVQLLIYTLGSSEACAAVAPPGWRYTGLPYMNAMSWNVEVSEGDERLLTITIDLRGLETLVSGACGEQAYLLVFVNGYPVYAMRVEG